MTYLQCLPDPAIVSKEDCEKIHEIIGRLSLNGKIKNPERIHFYEVRKVMRGEWEPSEAELVARALNSYAVERSRYEFPIIVCDSSGRKNGKGGSRSFGHRLRKHAGRICTGGNPSGRN